MNKLAQILRKLLMIVNTVISLPASVITTCEPVVSTTFVLVLTIAVVIPPWQRRVIVIKKTKKTLAIFIAVCYHILQFKWR